MVARNGKGGFGPGEGGGSDIKKVWPIIGQHKGNKWQLLPIIANNCRKLPNYCLTSE